MSATNSPGLGDAIQWFDGVNESLVGHSNKGEKGWSLGKANMELASEIGVGLDEGLLTSLEHSL